jgi:serine/threonine protein phosphatase PrpC
MDELMLTEDGKVELASIQEETTGMSNEDSFAGCTSTVVLITRNEVYCANAGDSRTVLASRGTAKDLSVDHKPDDP